jgi:Domain of unknown function (DUF4440)
MELDAEAWVKGLDRAWLEQRWGALEEYLDEGVVFVPPNHATPIVGRSAAIDSYRSFLSRCEVVAYAWSNVRATCSGSAAVIEYDWSMDWREGDTSHQATGREVLALSRSSVGYRAFWRTQIAT